MSNLSYTGGNNIFFAIVINTLLEFEQVDIDYLEAYSYLSLVPIRLVSKRTNDTNAVQLRF
jgi:hypothetical protein